MNQSRQQLRQSRIQTAPLGATVFALALPVLCEQFLTFCVGFYDTWLSGRLSSEATSAIGLAAYVGWLASMLFGLVGVGTTALVARSVGGGDWKTANGILSRSIGWSLLLGIAMAAIVFLSAESLARLLDMRGAAAEIAVNYLRRDAVGHVFYSFSLTGAAALRGAGDMRTPTLVLGLVSLANILFSTVLVYGAGPVDPIGVNGIVWGTVLARCLGGTLMLLVLVRGIDGLRLNREILQLGDALVRRILRIGIPAALDGAVMWFGQFLFLMVIARLGRGGFQSGVFAAHIVGIEMEAITYLPAVAWGTAAATMIGQCLGAGLPERAQQAGHAARRQCVWLASVLAVCFYFGAPGIYELMHSDPEVHRIGVPAFRLLAFFQVPMVVCIVYTAALRGAGDSRTPMLFTVFSVLGIRVPLAWLCGHVLEWGLVGAWIGMCADVLVRAILVSVRFVRGGWLDTRV